MSGISGCFGGTQQVANQQIDNLDEVSAAVDEIVSETNAGSEITQSSSVLAQHYAYMEKRVRMLTCAVVAIAIVILLKEL